MDGQLTSIIVDFSAAVLGNDKPLRLKLELSNPQQMRIARSSFMLRPEYSKRYCLPYFSESYTPSPLIFDDLFLDHILHILWK